MLKYLFFLFPAAASSQAIYDYTSGPITSAFQVESGITSTDQSLLGTDITGVITLAQALPANGVTAAVTPLSEQFNNVPWCFTGCPYFVNTSYSFTTQNNLVTGFTFSTYLPSGLGTSYAATIQGNSGSDSVTEVSGNTLGYTEVDAGAGGWADPSPGGMEAPEVNASGAVAAFTLLAGLLLVYRGRHTNQPR